MPRQVPSEMFNEIIGHLWNDIPSLKACSLANRIMTVPSQKRLFYCICLRAPRSMLKDSWAENETSGTSYDFSRLLDRSPHIAGYVQSLFIMDHGPIQAPSESEGDSDESDQSDRESLLNEHDDAEYEIVYETPPRRVSDAPIPRSKFYRWLVHDKYLPGCALLLHHVKAFTLLYDGPGDWECLPSEVYIALLRLLRLPSLLYVRLEHHYPSKLFDYAIGDNVKHLVLLGRPCRRYSGLFVRPRCPLSGLLYVDSLDILYTRNFYVNHFEDFNCRIKTSSLRKLSIIANRYEDHASVWTILQTCRETLEDFDFTPSHKVIRHNHNANTLNFDDPINLSELTSLKRFSVHLSIKSDIGDRSVIATHFPWFHRILLQNYPLPLSQHLENLSILLDYKSEGDIQPYLKDIFNTLLEDRFEPLKKFNIFLESDLEGVIQAVDSLDRSEHVAKLRSQRGMVVDVRACNRSFRFEPDVRWETFASDRWNHIDIHEDC